MRTVTVQATFEVTEIRLTTYEVPDDFDLDTKDTTLATLELETARDDGRVTVKSEEILDSDTELYSVLEFTVEP